eukprot:gene26942-biopygen17517
MDEEFIEYYTFGMALGLSCSPEKHGVKARYK